MKVFKLGLSVDINDLKAQFRAGSKELKNLVEDVTRAENKLKELGEAGSYLAQMDAALSKLRQKHPNTFNEIFGNVDADIKEALAPIMKMPELIGKSLSKIGGQLEGISTGKIEATNTEMKALGKEVQLVARALGATDVDFKFLDGSAKAQTKAKNLINILSQLEKSYLGLNKAGAGTNIGKIIPEEKGKGKGRGRSQTSKPSETIPNITVPDISGGIQAENAEIKAQIDELEAQRARFQEIISVFEGKNISLKTTKKTDTQQLKDLVDQFNEATNAVNRFETANNTSGIEYKKALGEQYRLASLVKNTMDSTKLSDKASNYVVSREGMSAYENAEHLLANLKSMSAQSMSGIKDVFTNSINGVTSQITSLTQAAATGFQNVEASAKSAADVIDQVRASTDNAEKFLYLNTKKGSASDFVSGDEGSISKEKMQNLLSTFGGASNFDSTLHTHLAKIAAPSGKNGDLDIFLNNYDKFKRNFILAGDQLAEIDFSSLTKAEGEKIRDTFEERSKDIDVSNYDDQMIKDLTTLTSDTYSKVGDWMKSNMDSILPSNIRANIGDDKTISDITNAYTGRVQDYLKTADVGNLTHEDLIDQFDNIAKEVLAKYPESIRKQLKNNLTNHALTGFDDVTGIQDALFNKTQQDYQNAFISSINEAGFDPSKIFKLHNVKDFDFKTFTPMVEGAKGISSAMDQATASIKKTDAAMDQLVSSVKLPNLADFESTFGTSDEEIAKVRELAEEYRVIHSLLQKGGLDKSASNALVERAKAIKDTIYGIRDKHWTDSSPQGMLNSIYGVPGDIAGLLGQIETNGVKEADNASRQKAIDLIQQEIVAEQELARAKAEAAAAEKQKDIETFSDRYKNATAEARNALKEMLNIDKAIRDLQRSLDNDKISEKEYIERLDGYQDKQYDARGNVKRIDPNLYDSYFDLTTKDAFDAVQKLDAELAKVSNNHPFENVEQGARDATAAIREETAAIKENNAAQQENKFKKIEDNLYTWKRGARTDFSLDREGYDSLSNAVLGSPDFVGELKAYRQYLVDDLSNIKNLFQDDGPEMANLLNWQNERIADTDSIIGFVEKFKEYGFGAVKSFEELQSLYAEYSKLENAMDSRLIDSVESIPTSRPKSDIKKEFKELFKLRDAERKALTDNTQFINEDGIGARASEAHIDETTHKLHALAAAYVEAGGALTDFTKKEQATAKEGIDSYSRAKELESRSDYIRNRVTGNLDIDSSGQWRRGDLESIAQQLGIEIPAKAKEASTAIKQIGAAASEVNAKIDQSGSGQPFEKIEQGANNAGASIEALNTKAAEAKAKFLELTSSLDADLFAGRYDEFSLGTSSAELDMAQKELQELANAGHLTANAMAEVNAAYSKTKSAISASYEGLRNENMYKEDAGSYDQGYSEGYFAAEKRLEQENIDNIREANELRRTVESLQQELNRTNKATNTDVITSTEETNLEQLRAKITSVTEAVQAKNAAFQQEPGIVSGAISQEISDLGKLEAAVDKVTAAVNAKTNAFKSEADAVSASIKQEEDAENKKEQKKDKEQKPKDTFAADKAAALKSLNEYRNSLNKDFVTADAFAQISALEAKLNSVTNVGELSAWTQEWNEAASAISQVAKETESLAKNKQKNTLKGISNSLSKDYKAAQYDPLTADEEAKAEIKRYNELMSELETHSRKGSPIVGDSEVARLEEEAAALKEVINLRIQKNKAAKAAQKQEDELKKEEERQRKAFEKGQKAQEEKMYKLFGAADHAGISKSAAGVEAINAVSNAWNNLKIAQENAANNPVPVNIQEVGRLEAAYDQATASLKGLITETNNLSKNAVWTTLTNAAGLDRDGRLKAIQNAIQQQYDGKAKIVGKSADGYQMDFIIKNSDGSLSQFIAQMNQAGTAIVATQGKLKTFDGAIKGLLKGSIGKIKDAFKVFTGYDLFFRGVQEIRKGVQYVTEIDTALTELKKVTNETDTTYANFVNRMSKTGSVVGATVKDLVNMSADWARLNY